MSPIPSTRKRLLSSTPDAGPASGYGGTDQDYPRKLTELGERYEHGRGVSPDCELAAALYRCAARKGHAAAQYKLGFLYADGRGVRRDRLEAGRWFRLAARPGYAKAKSVLNRER